jgi:hypothetical protein
MLVLLFLPYLCWEFLASSTLQFISMEQLENRPLGRPRRIWEDSTKIEHREIGWGGIVWTHVAQDRDWWRALVNTVMSFRVP